MQNLNERGAAYIPIAKARGITPHLDKKGISCFSLARIADYFYVSLTTFLGERTSRKLIGEMGKQELNLR